MTGNQQQDRAERDPSAPRERRVQILRELIAERSYDVPAEDVAASIIRDAVVIVSTTPPH